MSEKIKVGDVYGVYSVVETNKPTSRINDATIKLKCNECGEVIEKNYNHLLKQFRHGKLNSCICYSGTNKFITMSKEYEKLTVALSKLKLYYKGNEDFVCDRAKKIMKFMDASDMDMTDDRFEYHICTKDGSLRFVAGNVCFKQIVKTSTIDEVVNNVYVSNKLSEYQKRYKVSSLIKLNKGKTTQEIINGNQFISYSRDKLIQKIRIGSVYGNCSVIGTESAISVKGRRTLVVLRCLKCGNIFTRAIRSFIDGIRFCTYCEKDGYRSYIHQKNSVTNKSIEDKIKQKMEIASIECISDYSRYCANYECLEFNEIIDLKLDSINNKYYSYFDYIDVFGDCY